MYGYESVSFSMSKILNAPYAVTLRTCGCQLSFVSTELKLNGHHAVVTFITSWGQKDSTVKPPPPQDFSPFLLHFRSCSFFYPLFFLFFFFIISILSGVPAISKNLCSFFVCFFLFCFFLSFSFLYQFLQIAIQQSTFVGSHAYDAFCGPLRTHTHIVIFINVSIQTFWLFSSFFWSVKLTLHRKDRDAHKTQLWMLKYWGWRNDTFWKICCSSFLKRFSTPLCDPDRQSWSPSGCQLSPCPLCWGSAGRRG